MRLWPIWGKKGVPPGSPRSGPEALVDMRAAGFSSPLRPKSSSKLQSRFVTLPASQNRGQKLNTNFFFSNFSGTVGISRQNHGISHPKSLISLVSRDIPNFSAPTRARGRPPPHRKISRPKSLGLGSFFFPDRSVPRINLGRPRDTQFKGQNVHSRGCPAKILHVYWFFSYPAGEAVSGLQPAMSLPTREDRGKNSRQTGKCPLNHVLELFFPFFG